MSMDSARYVAFSRGLLGEVGTPWPWLVLARRVVASGSCRSSMAVSSVSAWCWRAAIRWGAVMVVLLSSRGSLAEKVLCSLLAGPVALLHDAGHHLRPSPLEGLRVAPVGHPRVQAVLLFAGQLLAGQAQALLFLPAGEILLPNPSLLGLLPLPLNLRVYIHFNSASFEIRRFICAALLRIPTAFP